MKAFRCCLESMYVGGGGGGEVKHLFTKPKELAKGKAGVQIQLPTELPASELMHSGVQSGAFIKNDTASDSLGHLTKTLYFKPTMPISWV